jgi:uncharacterized protein HemY
MGEKVFTYCLCIDIVKSTATLLGESTAVRDSFNIALSKIIYPFLEDYDLEDSYVKFTGDGWIINIENPEKITNLVVFALALNKNFHFKIAELTGISFPYQWKVKLGLSSGNDIKTQMYGSTDFIGDSIRRATRILHFCLEDEILVDSSVQRDTLRDFTYERKHIDHSGAKFEQDIGEDLYFLVTAKYSQLKNADVLIKYFDNIGNYSGKNNIIADAIAKSIESELSTSEKISIDKTSVALMQVGNSKEGRSIYNNLKASGYNRNLILWTKLVHSKRNFGEAKKVLEQMKKDGIEPNLITYSAYLNKVDNFKDAQKVIEQMKTDGIEPNLIIFNTFLNKVDNFKDAQEVIEQIKKNGIDPDRITYSTFLKKVDNFGDAQKIFEQMKEDGVEPNLITYSTFLNKVDNFVDAQKILTQMKADNIELDQTIFNTLLNKVDNFEGAQKVIEQMKKNGITPDQTTFNTLLNKVDNFGDAQKVIEQMKKNGIDQDLITYSTLLNKVDNFGDAQKVLEQMKKNGINPNLIAYSTFLNKVDNFADAQKTLMQMKDDGIEPNLITFNTLLKKVDNFENSQKVIDQMKKDGIEPDVTTYSTLLNKANNFEDAQKILEQMKEDGTEPNLFSYSIALKKDIGNTTVRTVHLWYVLSQKFHPSGPIAALIKQLQIARRVNDVFYLILHYPHLDISKSVMSQDLAVSLQNLDSFSNEEFYTDHIDYAKGILYFLHGNHADSNVHLQKLDLSLQPTPKQKDIQEMIKENEKHL